ncbi:MAG TPA: tripartite tricarboxylate transporter permease, partial [Candidatus Binatia bacterium]|nr:tripartite tricarboxylate transporter permease [Candidatus Binatia bacterium]
GFPQGVVTALFIVALLAWGYLPGPEMVKKNPELIYSIVWLQGIAGMVGTLIGFGLAAQLAKLAEVRYTFMVPVMFIFILMGAFSVNRDPADLVVVVAFGVLGYFMRRYGYPRPAMILGLVLGDLMEKYLYRSVASYGFAWLGRPAVIALLIVAAGSLLLTLRGRMKARNDASPASFSGAMARSEDES